MKQISNKASQEQERGALDHGFGHKSQQEQPIIRHAAEITFRTAAAGDAIQALSRSYPEMLVAAGTVLTVAQAEIALNAGAKFIVTPGFDADVVDWCLEAYTRQQKKSTNGHA